MSYRINVARQSTRRETSYAHLFDTTLQDLEDARLAYREIVRRFPAPVFLVEVTHWDSRGHDVTDGFNLAMKEADARNVG